MAITLWVIQRSTGPIQLTMPSTDSPHGSLARGRRPASRIGRRRDGPPSARKLGGGRADATEPLDLAAIARTLEALDSGAELHMCALGEGRRFDAGPNAVVTLVHATEHGVLASRRDDRAPHAVAPGAVALAIGELTLRVDPVSTDGRCDTLVGVIRGRSDAATFLMRRLPPLVQLDAVEVRDHARLDALTRMLVIDARREGRPPATLIGHYLAITATEVAGAWLARDHVPPAHPQTMLDERVDRVLRRLHADPAAEWTVDAMAAVAGMSRASFARACREVLDASPAALLRRIRLDAAEQLIARVELTLADIAERVGYSSETALSRAFHRERGVRPSDLRPDGHD